MNKIKHTLIMLLGLAACISSYAYSDLVVDTDQYQYGCDEPIGIEYITGKKIKLKVIVDSNKDMKMILMESLADKKSMYAKIKFRHEADSKYTSNKFELKQGISYVDLLFQSKMKNLYYYSACYLSVGPNGHGGWTNMRLLECPYEPQITFFNYDKVNNNENIHITINHPEHLDSSVDAVLLVTNKEVPRSIKEYISQ
jgi:hypothetical protein